ncbi:Flavoprotein [Streptomyces sp. LamerLS-31b]|uniref:flavoprotein n=1 Tax=Streptomyces TaxID=1883 RepID=UPI00081DA2BB|nr:flavoprotein [Streptomyces sp. LamerLS-31b]SCF58733.1 Flavoprotein [Streptomyces sp. LamerLS-31b]
MSETTAPEQGIPPVFGGHRLLYIATGSIGTMFLPMWLHWLRGAYPQMEVRCALTRSANQFVGSTAIAVTGGRPAIQDVWPDNPESATHVELSRWADTVLVHPATFHFTARFALGLADTPLLLALECTSAAIAVAPAPPPGADTSPAYRRHVHQLSQRPNVVVVPPKPGFSLTTGEPGPSAATLPDALHALENLRRSMTAPQQPKDTV